MNLTNWDDSFVERTVFKYQNRTYGGEGSECWRKEKGEKRGREMRVYECGFECERVYNVTRVNYLSRASGIRVGYHQSAIIGVAAAILSYL